MQVAETHKAELEVQISQLSEMSGDSSQQLAYLNEQLREKDRQLEELEGKHSSISGELERVKEDMTTQTDKQVNCVHWLILSGCAMIRHMHVHVL